MTALEKFGVEIFTQETIHQRISADKPFRPENPAFLFIKSGSIKLKQHLNDIELSANYGFDFFAEGQKSLHAFF